MRATPAAIACGDLWRSFQKYSLVGMLGWQDIRQRYRRSALGPFWLTISMGVMIGTIGIVFGQIFKSPLDEFLPFLTIGIILWGLMTTVVTEGCTVFVAAEGIIKQLPLPMLLHVFRMIWRNLLIFAHNLVIFPVVLIAVGKPLTWVALLSIPGLALTLINLTWVAVVLGIVCSRYRDLTQIVTSSVQVLFYLTPIMWMPKHLPAGAAFYLLALNPVYHLIEVVRAPLLGEFPAPTNWVVSLTLALLGSLFALLVYGRFKRRIPYWL